MNNPAGRDWKTTALYAFIAGTPSGRTSPENWRAADRPLAQVIAGLAAED